jgi:hypothetical protein
MLSPRRGELMAEAESGELGMGFRGPPPPPPPPVVPVPSVEAAQASAAVTTGDLEATMLRAAVVHRSGRAALVRRGM